jgi:hypothetical protein
MRTLRHIVDDFCHSHRPQSSDASPPRPPVRGRDHRPLYHRPLVEVRQRARLLQLCPESHLRGAFPILPGRSQFNRLVRFHASGVIMGSCFSAASTADQPLAETFFNLRANPNPRRVMAFASAPTPMRFSSLRARSKVQDSGMGNLDDHLDHLGGQLAAPLHRKLGRTFLPRKPTLRLEDRSLRTPQLLRCHLSTGGPGHTSGRAQRLRKRNVSRSRGWTVASFCAPFSCSSRR